MAAQQAQKMRNSVMNALRGKTSDFGLALARFMKKEGKSLQQLELKYAQELYKADFSRLNSEQKGNVWKKIVAKAGEPQVRVSNSVKWFGRAGRGLFVLTVAISVYHIAKAEDKVRATANEVIGHLTKYGNSYASFKNYIIFSRYCWLFGFTLCLCWMVAFESDSLSRCFFYFCRCELLLLQRYVY